MTTTLAYLAGIMDADGCFSAHLDTSGNRGRCSVYAFASIKQVQPEAIELLAATFGGTVGTEKPNALRGKPFYRWRPQGTRAFVVAETLLPFLRLKRPQAELVLALRDEIADDCYTLGPPDVRGVRRRMVTDASIERRLEIVRQLRVLNDSRQRHGSPT